MSAFLMSKVVENFTSRQNSSEKLSLGVLVLNLALICLSLFSTTFIYSYSSFQTNRLSFQVRSNLILLIFSKILKRDNLSPGEHSEGTIINYIQEDSMKVERLLWNSLSFLQLLISLTIGSVYIWGLLGGAIVAMYASLLLSSYLIFLVYKYRIRTQGRMLKSKDQKMTFLKNVLNNIQYIKTRALENFYQLRLLEYRETEIKELEFFAYVCAVFVVVVWFTRSFSLLSVLFYKTFVDSSEFGFVKIAAFLRVFDLIRKILLNLPRNLSQLIDIVVSIKRIEKFVNSDELDDSWITLIDENGNSEIGPVTLDSKGFSCDAITLKNGSFEWRVEKDKKKKTGKLVKIKEPHFGENKSKSEKESLTEPKTTKNDSQLAASSSHQDFRKITEEVLKQEHETEEGFRLKEINLVIPKGSLVFVIGKVGSGKSSLLYSILGQMGLSGGDSGVESRELNSPELIRRGSVSFLSESPWLMPNTILENIVMDADLDVERVTKSIKLSQFWTDLQQLPNGLDTVIGEDGKTLSGGQRTRLALARCIYKK